MYQVLLCVCRIVHNIATLWGTAKKTGLYVYRYCSIKFSLIPCNNTTKRFIRRYSINYIPPHTQIHPPQTSNLKLPKATSSMSLHNGMESVENLLTQPVNCETENCVYMLQCNKENSDT